MFILVLWFTGEDRTNNYQNIESKISTVLTLLVVLNESSLGTYWMSYTKKYLRITKKGLKPLYMFIENKSIIYVIYSIL